MPEKIARIVSESVDELPGVDVVGGHPCASTRTAPSCRRSSATRAPSTAATYDRLKPKGYLADDIIGKAGVEASFESALRGTYGKELVERDATGRDVQVLRTLQQAVPGASLTLTIDKTIQKEATAALKWGMRAAGLKRGVFIVMNPQTGEVLALVSLPTYDNNLFSGGISSKAFRRLVENKNKPLTNQAVQAQLPARIDVQAGHGDGRAGRQEDHPDHAHPDARVPDPRRRRGSTTGTTPASACATSTAASATRRTRSSSRWPACSARTGSPTGHGSTASGRPPGSTSRARSPASSPTTSGR